MAPACSEKQDVITQNIKQEITSNKKHLRRIIWEDYKPRFWITIGKPLGKFRYPCFFLKFDTDMAIQ